MLFSEVYGAYYDSVAEVLKEAVRHKLNAQKLTRIVQQKGFEESVLTIPQNLRDGTWPLLNDNFTTPLKFAPEKELTILQKRWMKAILQDPRIKLFDVPEDGLEDVEPLFTPDMFVYYDRYNNGDPFEDEGYIARFKTILEAIHTNRKVKITFDSFRGKHNVWTVIPFRLEYSAVDDKFRLLCKSTARSYTELNLGRMTDVQLMESYGKGAFTEPTPKNRWVTLEVTDERNTLERAMLQFSYLEKETERIDEKHYKMTLHFRHDDETELVIKILSFGPTLRVVDPNEFAELLRLRIMAQNTLS